MLKKQFEGWGLGVAVEGEGAAARFAHGGANEGFRCLLTASAWRRRDCRDDATPTAAARSRPRSCARWRANTAGRASAPVERTLGTGGSRPAYKYFAGRYEIGMRSPPVILRVEVGRRPPLRRRRPICARNCCPRAVTRSSPPTPTCACSSCATPQAGQRDADLAGRRRTPGRQGWSYEEPPVTRYSTTR